MYDDEKKQEQAAPDTTEAQENQAVDPANDPDLEESEDDDEDYDD